MASVTIPGQGMLIPQMPIEVVNGPVASVVTVSASTHSFAYCGRVFTKDYTVKNLQAVGFRTGGVTTGGGSFVQCSIQSVLLTTAGCVPNGTVKASAATLLTNLTANDWNQLVNLGSSVSVNPGDLIGVVFSLATFGGTDALGIASTGASANINQTSVTLNTTGTWTAQTALANVILQFDDGTFGTLQGAYPFRDYPTVALNTSTLTQAGLEFQLPGPVSVSGAYLVANFANSNSSCSVSLLDGSSILANGSVAINATQLVTTGATRHCEVAFPGQVALSSNHSYRLVVTPLTTNSVTLQLVGVSSQSHFQAHGLGTPGVYTSNVTSAFVSTNTQRPLMGLLVSAIDNGAAGGGGRPAHIYGA